MCTCVCVCVCVCVYMCMCVGCMRAIPSVPVYIKVMFCVGFAGPTAVVMKSSIFWDIILCSPLKVEQHFGETCRPHLQGQTVSQAKTSMKQVVPCWQWQHVPHKVGWLSKWYPVSHNMFYILSQWSLPTEFFTPSFRVSKISDIWSGEYNIGNDPTAISTMKSLTFLTGQLSDHWITPGNFIPFPLCLMDLRPINFFCSAIPRTEFLFQPCNKFWTF
jgi:hypothetical protein